MPVKACHMKIKILLCFQQFQTHLISLILIHKYMAMEIDLGDTELQNNILKFGYGINYKYVGYISHSFDRFFVVIKFELPKVQDLQFTTIPYDKNCEHLEDAKRKGRLTLGLIDDIKTYCIKIAPYIRILQKTNRLLQPNSY